MESFSPASCSVDGGEDLLIIGSNISAQSRVVFMEKGPGEITLCHKLHQMWFYIPPAAEDLTHTFCPLRWSIAVGDGRKNCA